MKKIAISPGHYEAYRGVSKNGFNEYDEVLKIANILKDKFDPSQYEIHFIEGKLIDKVNKINELNVDLAVEVHLGNTNSSKTDGSRSFHMLNRADSKQLAETLLESCVRMLGTHNRGAWIGWFKKISPSMVEKNKAPSDWKAKIDLFLSKITCTTAIIEPFYISSPTDCSRFISGNKHEFIAESIAEGIRRYVASLNQPNGVQNV